MLGKHLMDNLTWHWQKLLQRSISRENSKTLEESILLELLLDLDLVSAIRSESIMNGHGHGTQWYNQNEEYKEVTI